MVNNINNFGVINFFENQKAQPKNEKNNIEEVLPIEDDKPYPFVVPEKLAQLNLYSLSEFEGIYRKAVESDAKTLAKFLKKYADLKVLDFGNLDKKQIFETLKNRFPQIEYGYRNFTQYF